MDRAERINIMKIIINDVDELEDDSKTKVQITRQCWWWVKMYLYNLVRSGAAANDTWKNQNQTEYIYLCLATHPKDDLQFTVLSYSLWFSFAQPPPLQIECVFECVTFPFIAKAFLGKEETFTLVWSHFIVGWLLLGSTSAQESVTCFLCLPDSQTCDDTD